MTPDAGSLDTIQQSVIVALSSGQILQPIEHGQWGCFPVQRDSILVACNTRQVTELAIVGLIERVPDVGYILARNPPATVGPSAPKPDPRPPVRPYSFSDLLEGRADLRELSTVFHLHVPKAGGNTVANMLRQNNFTALDFDMNAQSFFGTVIEAVWRNNLLQPPPRRRFFMTGHYRLDAGILRTVPLPHAVITTLRDPIKRVLSHYNMTLLVPDNPQHEAVSSRRMSFLEFAEWLVAPNSVGPQYSFFDDTGTGTFARSGWAPVTRCLENLFDNVSLYGFTDRFDEFCALFGYLLRLPNIAVLPGNETAELNDADVELKSALTLEERERVHELYADDIWFYEQAKTEYDRRVSDPRIATIFGQAISLLREAKKTLQDIEDIPDPADPARPAFRRPR